MMASGLLWLQLLIAAAVYISAPALGKFSKEFAGPYDIFIGQVADCDNQGSKKIIIHSNKIRKFNRTTYLYSSNATLLIPVSDNIKLVAPLAVFGNGGWKENYFRQDLGGVCTAIHQFIPQFSKDIFRNVGITGCPIPQGNYTVTDLRLSIDLKWPSLPYNKYRLDASFYNKGKLVGCKRIFLNVVPKSKT